MTENVSPFFQDASTGVGVLACYVFHSPAEGGTVISSSADSPQPTACQMHVDTPVQFGVEEAEQPARSLDLNHYKHL